MDKFKLPFSYAQRSRGNSRDYVFFSAFDPAKDQICRKRIYIDHVKDPKLRDRHARKLIDHINTLLDTGQNPFIDQDSNKKYSTIDSAFEFVKNYKNTYIRKRTKHTYDSRLNVLDEWLCNRKLNQKYIFEFTEDLARLFMNELIMKRKIKGRTFNNYLVDYRTFFNLLVKNKYLNRNPFHSIEFLPEQETDKRAFRDLEAHRYFSWILNNDFDFYVISMYCYYLAVRPAEIVRLKISDFWLEKGVLIVPGSKSKNKEKRIIPIALPFLAVLRNYLSNYPEGYYICGKKLKPGPDPEYSTRIAERFREIANQLQIPSEVKFYSLKDTAADKLIDAGFSAKTIRDLFGHSSILITDKYLKKVRSMIDQKLINNFPAPYKTAPPAETGRADQLNLTKPDL